MRLLTPALALAPLLFPLLALAQFGQFFEQMFHGGGGGGGHHQQQREQDVASDASWYKKTYEGGSCPHPIYLPQEPG